MTSDGETAETKFMDPNENYNFVADGIFIWNRLELQIFIFKC